MIQIEKKELENIFYTDLSLVECLKVDIERLDKLISLSSDFAEENEYLPIEDECRNTLFDVRNILELIECKL